MTVIQHVLSRLRSIGVSDGCCARFTARVANCGELDQALDAAGKGGTGVYVEVVTDAYAASPLSTEAA